MNWLKSGWAEMPAVQEAEEHHEQAQEEDLMQVDAADSDRLEGSEEDNVNNEGYAPSTSSRGKGKGKQVYGPRSARIAGKSQRKGRHMNS